MEPWGLPPGHRTGTPPPPWPGGVLLLTAGGRPLPRQQPSRPETALGTAPGAGGGAPAAHSGTPPPSAVPHQLRCRHRHWTQTVGFPPSRAWLRASLCCLQPRPPPPAPNLHIPGPLLARAASVTLTLFLRLLVAALCEKEGNWSREGRFRPSCPWILLAGAGGGRTAVREARGARSPARTVHTTFVGPAPRGTARKRLLKVDPTLSAGRAPLQDSASGGTGAVDGGAGAALLL